MFRFMREPSSGSQSQYLAKVTVMVPLCLLIWTLSVLRRHMCLCIHTHTQQVGICRHNTDNVHIDKHSGIIPVILARYWLWFSDDGSCV